MEIFRTLTSFSAQQLIMIAVGLALMYLAIVKEYEPALLLPMGFGTILVNIPFSAALTQMVDGKLQEGALSFLFNAGIVTEMFPLLIFIAIGAMCDFTPLFQTPLMFLFGLTAQVGIFVTMGLAILLGFDIREAASIGIIGAADGPTSIFVASRFAPHLLGPISVAAYSYMALVPLIQPPVVKLMTTKAERAIRMPYKEKEVPRFKLIALPIVTTFVASVIAPASSPLIGFLMFGNLLRVSGVVDRLSKGAQNELANIVTILLGLAISASMTGDRFIRPTTMLILGMGLFAFIIDTAGGILSAKFVNLFLKEKINPMVGAAGISAFPMSARVMQRLAKNADHQTFILMQAIAANASGQIGSVLAGGILLAIVH